MNFMLYFMKSTREHVHETIIRISFSQLQFLDLSLLFKF